MKLASLRCSMRVRIILLCKINFHLIEKQRFIMFTTYRILTGKLLFSCISPGIEKLGTSKVTRVLSSQKIQKSYSFPCSVESRADDKLYSKYSTNFPALLRTSLSFVWIIYFSKKECNI